MADRMKAVVHLDIKVPVEISDGGYLGDTKSSIKEHIEHAKEDVSRYKIFVQKPGDAEPKPVRAVMSVSSVQLLPKDN